MKSDKSREHLCRRQPCCGQPCCKQPCCRQYPKLIGLCFLVTFSFIAGQSGWQPVNFPAAVRLNAVHFVNADSGYVAGAAAAVYKTTDGGATWQDVSPIGETGNLNGLRVAAENPDQLIAVGDAGVILLSSSGGGQWQLVPSGVGDDLYAVSASGTQAICAGSSQTILFSTNGGSSWNIAQTGFFGGGFYGAQLLDPAFAFVAGENSIFQPLVGRSTDGGATWSFSSFLLNNNEGRINGADFTDINSGHAVSRVFDGRGAISRTSDGGVNWQTSLFPQELIAVQFPISNASLTGYAVGAGGTILKTTDAGASWQSQNSGVTATLRALSFVDLDNGFVVGDNGTVIKTHSGGEPPNSVLPAPGAGNVPAALRLQQNFPNPFNPSTHIRFELAGAGEVDLTVHDLHGQNLRTLIHGRLPAGPHETVWDGRDGHGLPVPAGVYFYRLRQGEQSVVRKMLLVR